MFKKNHAEYDILFKKQLVVRYINATSLELPHTHHKKRGHFPLDHKKRTYQQKSTLKNKAYK